MMKLANYARQFDAHVFRFPCLIGDNRCRAHQLLCFQDQGKRWLEIRVADPAHERLEDRVEDVNGRCSSTSTAFRFAPIIDSKSGSSLRNSIVAWFCRRRWMLS
jgi:hypothetical protein